MATTLQEVSENWDDDFEFQVERRKMSTATVKTEATENWDDDFEDSRQSPKKIRHREESWDDEDDEDDDGEFGLFAEEDRTVTARSRRAALARLSNPQSFSPTSSVFSVPTTIQTYSSTTHLRPTSAFALIPPSPPIHKERERRRLRKKSRPKPQGVFELVDMAPQERRSFSDVEVEGDLPPESGLRRTALSSKSDLSSVDERQPPIVTTPADTSIGSSNGPVSIPPTPTKGAALLSRIGSVKKWGVRRKRGDSTAPADTVAMPNEPPSEDPGKRKGTTGQDAQSQSQLTSIISYLPTPGKGRRRGGSTTPADVISNDRRNEFDPRLTPRASSSLSSYQQQHQQQHPLPPALPPLPLPHHPHSSSSHSTPQLLAQQQQQRAASSNWFFRSASKSGNGSNVTATTNSELGSTSSSTSKGAVQSRRSGSRSRVGREGDDADGDRITTNGNAIGNTTTNDTPNSHIYSTRMPSGSRTDLNEHEEEESSVDRKVSWSGKRSKGGNSFAVPTSASRDGDAGNPKLPTLTPTTTPTKLIKRKSFGFVHLGRGFGGHGGGENEVVTAENVSRSREEDAGGDGDMDEDYGEGKQEKVGKPQNQKDKMRYAGLGLGRVGVKAGGDGDEYEENEVSKRSRRRSLSRFLMDRDKDKEKENGQGDGVREKEKEKEGSRTFMGGVRRISLVSVGVVGRHKRTKSGSFVGGGGSPARIPPVPSALPPVPVLASASQVSLRIPSTTTTSSNERYPSSEISNVRLQRAASLSSPNGGGTSGDPTSSSTTTAAAGGTTTFKPQSGSTSRPSSISSSTRRRTRTRPRTISKPRSKPRKSEEQSHDDDDDQFAAAASKVSLELRQERGRDREPFDSTEEIDINVPKTPTRSSAMLSSSSQPPPPPAAAMPLLPPIELQPPSPPRTTPKKHVQRRSRAYTTNEFVEGLDLEGLVVMPSASSSSSVFFTPTSSFNRSNLSAGGAGVGGAVLPFSLLSPNNKMSPSSPGKSPSQSQQSVSLGRSTVNAAVAAATGDEIVGGSAGGTGSGAGAGGGGGGIQRRNSLGDLKIPARISQAQVGLRRDLGMVREFASNVEQLKELQTTYNSLVLEVQTMIDAHIQRAQSPVEKPPPAAVPQTSTSPNFFSQLKSRPKTRARSNTNPTPSGPSITPTTTPDPHTIAASSHAAYKSFVERFWSINSKYRIPWECAELLIELGSGGGDGGGGGVVVVSAPPSAAATTSVSAPVIQQLLSGNGVGGGGEGKMFSLKGRERAITLMSDESKHSTTTPPPPPSTHDEEQQQQIQVQSQPSSAVVSITGSVSLPDGGIQQAKATGPPLASPPSMSWRASTGRHDLSQRQLVLLREMLNNGNGTNLVAATSGDEEGGLRPPPPPPPLPIPLVEEDSELSRPSALSPYYYPRPQFVNRDWRWGDARSSTITLSEEQESGGFGGGVGSDEGGRRDRKSEKEKKRRSGRLGMSGIRDMLRSLKKGHVEEPKVVNLGQGGQVSGERYPHLYQHGRLPPAAAALPMMHSTTSLSTESSIGSRGVHHQQSQAPQQNRLPIPRIPSQIRRRGRSSTGPESMRSNKGPSPTSFSPSSFTTPKPSPRRPSLASIFRIGSGGGGGGGNSNNNKTRPVSSGGGVPVTGVGVGEGPATSSSSAFVASEHDLSAAQCSTGTGGEESNSTGGEEEEEDWDRMDSASDLDAAAAKALGIVVDGGGGAYDVSATVRGRHKLKVKADEKKMRTTTGVSPYLQHQPSYESVHYHHHPPLPAPPLPTSSSPTGIGGFLARHSIIPKRSFSASQSSIWGSGGTDGQQQQQQQHSSNVPSRLSRHSNFEEQQHTNVEPHSSLLPSSKSTPVTTAALSQLPNTTSNIYGTASSRPSSSRSTKFPNINNNNNKTGSVRSMPAHLVAATAAATGSSSLLPSGMMIIHGQSSSSPLLSTLPDPKLAMIMTPENIKPLLENAKEVHVKLHECVAEIRALIEDGAAAVVVVVGGGSRVGGLDTCGAGVVQTS